MWSRKFIEKQNSSNWIEIMLNPQETFCICWVANGWSGLFHTDVATPTVLDVLDPRHGDG